MAKFKCFDFEDGRETNVAYFSGYPFGDRLLEGVMFKATVLPDGKLAVEVAPKSKSHMSGLNEKHWLEEAKRWAEQGDFFSEREDGGEDLLLIES